MQAAVLIGPQEVLVLLVITAVITFVLSRKKKGKQ